MKKIIITSMALVIALCSNAQNLAKGKSQLNVGVGFSDVGVPVYIGFDNSIGNNITLGLELAYRGYRENYKNYYYKHSVTSLSANGNYHFNKAMNIPNNFDFYAGLNVGFFVLASPSDYYGSHTTGLGLGAQVGGRYFFSNSAGLNLEIGGGNSFIGGKFGLTFKL